MATTGLVGPMEIPKPLNKKEDIPGGFGVQSDIDKRDVGCAR